MTFEREYRLVSSARVGCVFPLLGAAAGLLISLVLASTVQSAQLICTTTSASGGGRRVCTLTWGTLLHTRTAHFEPGTPAHVHEGVLVVGDFTLSLPFARLDPIAAAISQRMTLAGRREVDAGFSMSDACTLIALAAAALVCWGIAFGGVLRVRATETTLTFSRRGREQRLTFAAGSRPKLHIRGRTLFVEGGGVVVRRAPASQLKRVVADLASWQGSLSPGP